LATDLKPDDLCVVATQNKTRDVVEFVWFSFDEETKEKCRDSGVPVRVQRGTRIKSEKLKKSVASKTKKYGALFNVLGHFRRKAVI
jgi:hypothetical protein